jgi:hypothetical protein
MAYFSRSSQLLSAGRLWWGSVSARWAIPILVLSSLLLACGGQSVRSEGATTFQRYDFEGAEMLAWQPDKRFRIGENHVLGVFNNRNPRHPPGTRLTLRGLSPDAPLTLGFDLFLIGTWDSGGELADRWELRSVDGPPLLTLTAFPNTFSDPDETVAVGNTGWVKLYGRQRAYWVVRQTVTISPDRFPEGSLVLTFSGALTGRRTEFWALDQVEVYPARDR